MAQLMWTEELQARALTLLGTMPIEQVASQLSLTTNQLKYACCNRGWSYAFKRPRTHSFSDQEKEYVRKNAGRISATEMGKHLNVSAQQVSCLAFRLGVSTKLKSRPEHITDDDIRMMRALSDEGIKYNEIADKFDVEYTYCYRICTYKSETGVSDIAA